VVVCICHPNYEGGIKRLAWAKTGDSISKITRAIWRNGERLPGKHEALSSNSSSAKKKKKFLGWALVARACNHSYSGGSNWEDHGSKLAREISS
jgi:hypothetical protein